MKETNYRIELLYETNSLSEGDFKKTKSEITELRRMLVSSINTINNQLNNFREAES